MTTPAGVSVLVGGQWLRGTQPAVTPPPPGGRFFGDPGVGKVMTGSTVLTSVSTVSDGLTWLNQNTVDATYPKGHKHLLARRYPTDLWSRTLIAADHAAGRVPFPSFKLNANPTNAAAIIGTPTVAGTRDADLIAEAKWAAKLGYPIFASFYHEPEDNWATDANAALYRGIFRHIVTIFKNNGATNVNWGPIYVAPYTFTNAAENARGGWWKWDPDWMGTKSGANGRPNASDWYTGTDAVCTLTNFDQYNPEVNTVAYRDLSTQMDPVFSKIAGDGRTVLPWLIPEMGTTLVTSTTLPMPSDGWTGYFQRMFRYMAAHQGVGYTVFNVFPKYNFINGDDHVARLAGYTAALTSESSYLVTVRPA